MRGAWPAPRGVRVLSRRHSIGFPGPMQPDASLLIRAMNPRQLYFNGHARVLHFNRTRINFIESTQVFTCYQAIRIKAAAQRGRSHARRGMKTE